MPSIASIFVAVVQSHVSLVDGDVVSTSMPLLHQHFDTVYSVLLTEIFMYYTIVRKEARHINIQVLSHT
jgi:hypothetical protein